MSELELEYIEKAIECAADKLKDSNKPLSEAQLLSGVVSRLKKKEGKEDSRHTNKQRFKKEVWHKLTVSTEWRNRIGLTQDGKFALRENISSPSFIQGSLAEVYNKEEITKLYLEKLRTLNSFQFECLVRDILNKNYRGYDFQVNSKTGDGGFDIIGQRPDFKDRENKVEVIVAEVKRFKNNISREKADKFVGACDSFTKRKDISKFTGFYITTSDFTQGFIEKLQESNRIGVSYFTWGGEKLLHKMLKHGIGIKYSPDPEFWKGKQLEG